MIDLSLRPPVTVYSKDKCVQCDAVKKYLTKHDIPYVTFEMDKDEDALAAAKALGYLQAPVVVVPFYDGQESVHFSGFNPLELAKIPR